MKAARVVAATVARPEAARGCVTEPLQQHR
jgi:hypothetical protein